MYVKSVVLDGFKSYGNRTEITGFDKEFNAITGLNGTGKSNILDAICFVLGITNLSNVRAASLQDLVYKNGQSGITRASVSITFDNRDKSQSPVGYQDYDEFTVTRQVVMGGKNKYLLNGTTVQNKRIQDLFCSVQLNVNNPHFLIMQGRITKVLNMKPPEILGMIEEAAGTKMYENKRSFAQKTIEKKDAKLQEIVTLINEEINPKLNKLREERQAYQEFQNLERHLQHLKIKYTAWQYIQARKQGEQARNQLNQAQEVITNLEARTKEAKDRIDQIDREVNEAQAKDDGTDEKFKELEAMCKEKEKLHTKGKSDVRTATDNVATEEKKLKQLEKALAQDEKALASKKREMEQASDEFERLREAERQDTEQLNLAQKRLEALHAGMDLDEEGKAATLHEQLMSAKELANNNSTLAKQHKMKLDFTKGQLQEKKQLMKGSRQGYDKDRQLLETCQKELATLQRRLESVNYNEETFSNLKERRQKLIKEIRNVRDRLENFERRNPLTDFKYTNPEQNWNKNRVHGVVCNLVKLRDNETARALETAAGGRLFNVVVDTEATSKKLLTNGQLRHRTTIIPLNKISGHAIQPQVVNLAQKMFGKENIQPALSLIEYPREVHSAMQYVFGGTFICKDMSIASKVAFDERIRCKCVTLDGDVCDPGGTLSGGAVSEKPPIFTELGTIKAEKENINKLEAELQKIDKQLHEINEQSEKYHTLARQIEMKEHELRVLSDRLASTEYGRLQQEVETFQAQVKELEEQLIIAEKTAKEASVKAAELEKRVKDAKGGRQQQIKDAEKLVVTLKKKASASQQQWNKREQEYESRTLEITELEKSIENGRIQIEASKQKITELQQILAEVTDSCAEKLEDVKKAQNELKELKHLMNMKNKEIQKKLESKQKLQNEISEIELEIKKQSHVVEELNTKYKDVSSAERNLEKQAKMDEKVLMEAQNMSDKEGHNLGNSIAKCQDQRNKMARTVNLKAQSMFEQEEKTYTVLMKRKKTIDADKRKFLKLLEDVDKKKSEALTKACEQISRDFGSIFGTLLPGADSKLTPPAGKTLLEGLEIKVALGGIWRDSLSELSGGQKSLIALSLILAMLLYKPAPIYILDEVDAALDLSHTQNIGNMLRKHFKHSQFIIVSLKDGMFSNANVLFRTKFVDGMSAVQRTVNTNRH